MYNRISILGGSGSGKSTLCTILSKELGLPAIHLDAINFNPNWKEIDKQERDKIISAKSKEDKWIIDGNYNKTLKERLDPTFVKYVLTYNKKKRHIILEHLQNIPNEKVLIFRHQKDLNNWLKTFTNNPNILYCYILL